MNKDFNSVSRHDIVISSRVRLARNFDQYPFPPKMNNKEAEEIVSKVKDTLMNYKNDEIGDLLFLDMDSLGDIDKQMLVEKHLISPDLATSKRRCAAIISKNEKTSVMINEEDHLRIQTIFHGMQIDNAWKLCDKIDNVLDKSIEYACSETYGYLTCCPTNLGTGIRVSVMLHLPALVIAGYIGNILEACSKLNIAVRGMYGEHSEAIGNMFQMSNQITLGQTEEEIISSIKNIAMQVVEQENTLRNQLYKQNTIKFEDKVYRSYGILANARSISAEESLRLISDVRLGMDMGIIKNISIDTLNEIMLSIQPACLQKLLGKPLDPDERDVRRAELVRRKLRQN
ncbi:MAG: protein arginine kinase [Clostridiaceae bacterium]|nr:protein arginine kinase [Clostridiaceae bacterium]